MAFVDIGQAGGAFDNASGYSWAENETNYAVLYANWAAFGITSLNSIRITLSHRESGINGLLAIINNGIGSFYLEDDSGSLVTTFIFPNPVTWESVDLSIQIGINYAAMTLISVEGEGTGTLFGSAELWTNYRNCVETNE